LILFFISFISKAQPEKELQNHLVSIDKMIRFNSVDTLFLDSHSDEEPVKIIAFYKNDVLLKTQISFVNYPKKRIIYYFPTHDAVIKAAFCYVKEFDTITNQTFIEIKYWKEEFLNGTKIKESDVEHVLKLSEVEKWRISDLEQAIFFKKFYQLRKAKAEIIEISEWEFIACGFSAFYATFKLRLIEENKEVETIFLGVFQCPRSKGGDFFEIGKIYEIELKKCFERDECYVDERYKNSNLSVYSVEQISIFKNP
jgi:hypothetical protein